MFVCFYLFISFYMNIFYNCKRRVAVCEMCSNVLNNNCCQFICLAIGFIDKNLVSVREYMLFISGKKNIL